MEIWCKGKIGALNAESLAERVDSIAKLIMTDEITLLTDNLLKNLVNLQMNAEFMKHMREHYSAHFKVEQPFGMTVDQDDE